MPRYHVNMHAQENGDHEVHQPGCSHLPDVQNRRDLGDFNRCNEAVIEAKKHYPKSNGCYYCSNACHTT